MEWRQHVVRRNDERTVKELLVGKPGEGSKQGRPNINILLPTNALLLNI